MNRLAALLRRWVHGWDLRGLAWVLLGAWSAGLVVAAVQLEGWQAQLTRTLLQLQADAQFRARAGPRDQVDPEWYRRKALALLAVMEQLRRDDRWTVLIPGSWRPFDDLEQRLGARLEREFADIVMETLRRELVARTATLTGARLPLSGALRPPDTCSAPAPAASAEARRGDRLEDLPEFHALRAWLEDVRPLDEAVQAWRQLHGEPGEAGAGHLRRLVRYTLDADLPGPVSRSVAMFGTAPGPAGAAPEATQAALQAALRCTFLRGTAALDERWLAGHELLALERTLAEHSAGLFEPRRTEGLVPTLQRLRAVHAVLLEEQSLLARTDTAWIRQDWPRPGTAHEALLAQAGSLHLLGEPAVRQAREQSAAALQRFRQSFDALFCRGGPSTLAWDASRGAYAFSPGREALAQGLARLLQEPLLRLGDDGALPTAPPSFEAALGAWAQRQRLRRELLPRLPDFARGTIARLVDARLALYAHDAAANAIRAGLPQDIGAPFDPAALRAQREPIARVQALLAQLGAPDLAQRLATQQAAELAARLARAWQELRSLPLFAHVTDFGWWRGEPAPLLKAMGVADAGALQNLLVQQFGRVDAMVRQASPYLAAAEGALARDAAAQHWERLAAEADRWRAHLPDSSMLAMQRYLLELGPGLHKDNCVEQLQLHQPMLRHDDEVGLRLAQMHGALMQRCMALRADALAPAGPVATVR